MPDFELIIGNKNYSSWSLRPWLTLRQFGIPFVETSIALDTATARDEKLEHAPTARVPVLRMDGFAIWDSLAICEYLAETYPEKELWPAGAHARARARSLCAEMHSSFLALRTEMPMNCRGRSGTADPKRRDGDEVRADVARVTQAWVETRAEFGGGGPFLFGEFSIADAFFAPVVSRFVTYAIELEGGVRGISRGDSGVAGNARVVAGGGGRADVVAACRQLPVASSVSGCVLDAESIGEALVALARGVDADAEVVGDFDPRCAVDGSCAQQVAGVRPQGVEDAAHTVSPLDAFEDAAIRNIHDAL